MKTYDSISTKISRLRRIFGGSDAAQRFVFSGTFFTPGGTQCVINYLSICDFFRIPASEVLKGYFPLR